MGIGAVDLIAFTGWTVFHPESDPCRPQGCERPARGRVDELLPRGLGIADYLFDVLPEDPSRFHKALDSFGYIQTYLLRPIHQFLGLAANPPRLFLRCIMPIFVAIGDRGRGEPFPAPPYFHLVQAQRNVSQS
jgi:hypothetical protein